MEKKISVKDLLMQAFLTGWELSDKSIAQDEYLQSAIQVIEVLQVEPENVYAEEGLGLTDGDEVDHLDDLLRADGQWLYYGVEAENFFLIQWYPDEASAKAKLATARGAGRRQAVPRGPEPQAHEPHRGREFRQFQPGAAEKLTSQSRFARQLPYRGEPLAKR